MTADVWEAVIQRWSAPQLLIRNSKTGPVWPTDGWMGSLRRGSHLPLCSLHIPDISETICLGMMFCGEAAYRLHMVLTYDALQLRGGRSGAGTKRDVVKLTLCNEAGCLFSLSCR